MHRRPIVVAVVGAVLAAASPAGAAGSEPAAGAIAGAPPAAPAISAATTGSDLAVRADRIADDVAARWALLQLRTGRFPDPIAGTGEDYGTAMLGLAIARRGAERGDRGLVRQGLDAILAEVERPTNGAFEPLVLAEAYRWGSATLASSSELRDLWEQAEPMLRADLVARKPAGDGTAAARCLADPKCWNNLKLVGALAATSLLRTGLPSSTPGALLADPTLADQVAAMLAGRVASETGDAVRRRGGAALLGGGILSDPARDPLAYHALSTALLGRLVDELGPAAPPAAVAALDRASRALLLLAAPNGDLTWWGRGQGQVWVPAIAAEAAARAAGRAPDRGDLRGRYLALAATELARLRSDYGVGAIGMPLVPGAVDAATLRTRSVDPYATTRGYNGLAVDALDRAAALLAAVGGRATSVPATRSGAVRSPKQAGLATLSRGGTWVAIAARDRAAEDARYGSGLLSLQARDATGAWTDRIPARPHAARRLATLAIRDRGELLSAAGTITSSGGSDAITIAGQWSRPGGGHAVDPGTRWRWSLAPDGTLTAGVTLRHSHVVVATALAGDDAVTRRTTTGVQVVSADGSTVTYALRIVGRSAALTRSRRELGASAYDANLRAVELGVSARAGERVVLTVRAAGAPPVAGG